MAGNAKYRKTSFRIPAVQSPGTLPVCGYMPKAKPDQVIVHRIELQETERATLEAALAGRFVTNAALAAGNLLNGVGAALAPFSGALTALAAVWIADKSWDQLKEKVLDPIVDVIDEKVVAKYAGDYSEIVAWLNMSYSTKGWDFLQTDNSSHEGYMTSAEGASILWRNQTYDHPTLGKPPVQTWAFYATMPSWLVDRFDSFIYTMKQNTAIPDAEFEKQTPAEWWVQFYPYAEFVNEVKWYAKNR